MTVADFQEVESRQATVALTLTTIAFSICFAAWVINAMLVTYLTQNSIIEFTAQQVGWLIAAPILTGAISRVPLGILTDKYGGQVVMTSLLVVCAIPMFLLSMANTFAEFLVCSLGFGIAGGGFAVGIGYVSAWYSQDKQGTALGVFGMGNAGAAITSLAAPSLLASLAVDADPLEAWRQLPQIYALVLVLMAVIFFAGSQRRLLANAQSKSLAERLAPLKSGIVWRFGLYYALVFGTFVAVSQWLVPYGVSVYRISLVDAGILAAVFSLPSGFIRAVGGWLSDKYGARTLMYTVFLGCAICCTILAIPKMNIVSPGVGVSAKAGGIVNHVSPEVVVVSGKAYKINPKPDVLFNEQDSLTNSQLFPSLQNWQEVNVELGDSVTKDRLIATGVSNLYYPANIWVFGALVFALGILIGIGKAGVFKFIPDHFPDNVGTVGGIVSLIGALGGFVLPMIFGYLLSVTGVWTTCWIVLAALSVVCLAWMHSTVRRIMQTEAPNLARLIESSASRSIPITSDNSTFVPANVESLLQSLPFFRDLTHEELHAIAIIGEFVSNQQGDVIFQQGDSGDALYVLITGRVKIFLEEGDQRIDLEELEDGTYFGDMALIDGQQRSATVQALENCEFFLIDRTQFLNLMTNSPRILADVLIGLSEHIRNTNQRYVDINEKKERLQTQAELERHQSIAQMVAGVAHEINTPLGIVNHAASIITEDLNEDTIEELAKDEDAEETLEGIMLASQLIQDNIKRADKLITSFKNLSVRQITNEREEVNVGEVIEDVLRLVGLKTTALKLDMIFDNQISGLDRWDGYPGQLGQVLMNLISNVDRYAYPDQQGGKVEVVLCAAGDLHPKYEYIIKVQDFGAGIDSEAQGKVFDAFYTTGRGKGGAGIGLSIVHNLVTFQFDGKIELESKVGEGSCFSIYLPRIVVEKKEPTHIIQGDATSV